LDALIFMVSFITASATTEIMNGATSSAEVLRRQIAVTEEELRRLKEQLAHLEAEKSLQGLDLNEHGGPVTTGKWPLEPEDYSRYGRQMIVPNIGIQGEI
jgi:adenylyltransferase/sulfurtransferase